MGLIGSVRLKLLGGFSASLASGRAVELAGKKNRALLAYLALGRGKWHGREKLMALLWSDRGEAQARGSLRQALSALKQAMAEGTPAALVLEGDSVSLEPEAVATDVAELEALAGSESIGDLRQAAELYEGDLLDGLGVHDPSFEEWLAVERTRLREVTIGVLGRLTAGLAGTEAVAMAQRLVALDPLREASHRALMKAYAGAGEKTLALQHYTRCRDLLRAELGVAPARETEELRQRLLQEEGTGPPPAERVAPRAVSIAVLPFLNLSDEPEQEYFSDGLTEDIITDLSRVSALFVAARNNVFTLKGRTFEIGEAARKLNVGSILEGSVRKSGSRIRIAVQLIDAATGGHLWAERYDRDLGDVFALQDDISKNVVSALKVRLLPEEAEAITNRSTTNAQAYDCYLSGRSALLSSWGDRSVIRSVRQMFARAAAIDPGYARAYAGLADCDALLWRIGEIDVSYEDILANSSKALALTPNLAEAHVSKGIALHGAGHFEEAAATFERAADLDPGLFEAHYYYGMTCRFSGRYEKAMPLLRRAAELRDMDFMALTALADVCLKLGLREQSVSAAKQSMTRLESALAKQPDNATLLAWGATILAVLDEYGRADEWAKRAVALSPNNFGVRVLAAGAYACIGNSDTALECLEFNFYHFPRLHRYLLGQITHTARIDPIRDQAEFGAFVKRLEVAVTRNL